MKPFLKQIAERFYKELNVDISDVCFVFPSRRAGKFFIEHIKNLVKEPIMAPQCLTISEFFDSLLPEYEKEDKIGLLFHLYNSYIKVTQSNETFNEFIGLGEIILKDFNDIDNYLVSPKYIFSNIKEIKKYEQENVITKEQVECIERFLKLFTGNLEDYKKKTYEIWCKMLEIYNDFNEKLLSEKICYDGMLHRMVVENPISESLLPANVVFIGFNALDGATKALFDILKSKGIADFYWDYDFKYADISEDKYNKAHYFIKDNLKKYKSKYTLEKENYPETEISVIGCSSNIGQSKYTNALLEENSVDNNEIKTALILADESLLIPTLYSLPENKSVNITMGYPIKYTIVYNFIEFFLTIHKNYRKEKEYRSDDIKKILDHPYVIKICNNELSKIDKNIFNSVDIPSSSIPEEHKLLKAIFTPCNYTELPQKLIDTLNILDEYIDIQLDKECINQAIITIKRTQILLEQYKIIVKDIEKEKQIDSNTIYKILTSVLKITNLSFLGEPLSGIQMMGMLETRCLDFDNIIITSFNEGIFPKSDIGTSLIPYSIRKPYGLPTTDHQDAIFSYNFYRLIKRASKVWLIYDTRNNNDNCTGEVSRFVKQLEYIYNVPINKGRVSHVPKIYKNEEIILDKTDDDIIDINTYFQTTGFTASALNSYIKCPLLFYYQYIKKINEPVTNNFTINPAQLGKILHLVMELIYTPFNDKMVNLNDLDKITKNYVEDLTQKAFVVAIYDLKNINEVEKYSYNISGENKILYEIIIEMVLNLIECDKKRVPFKHISNEKKYEKEYTTKNGNKIKLKGYIDKVDEKENSIQLIDYKTTILKSNLDATKVESIEQLENFFLEDNDKKYVKEILQMCFYNLLYPNKYNKTIETYLYLTRKSFDHDNFLENTRVTLPDNWEKTFKIHLDKVIDDLLDKENPIKQCTEEKHCKYCQFAPICGRGN